MWLVYVASVIVIGHYFSGYNLLLTNVNFGTNFFPFETEKCIECHQTLSLCEEGAMPDYPHNRFQRVLRNVQTCSSIQTFSNATFSLILSEGV